MPNNNLRIAWGVLAFLVVIVVVFFAVLFGGKAFQRYQSRADRDQNRHQAVYDAQNQTTINGIRISQQEQLVKVAQQQAEIRYQNAVGVRKAQDEISSTLTPLYVQFEMIDALKAVATSGQNNTVVYIPTGDSGIPIISTTDPTKVGGQ